MYLFLLGNGTARRMVLPYTSHMGTCRPKEHFFLRCFGLKNEYRPGAIIGVGDRKGADSIEIAICAIFRTNCAISCDTRALFLLGRRVRDEQTKRPGKLPP